MESFIRNNLKSPIVIDENSAKPKVTSTLLNNDPNKIVQEIEVPREGKKFYIFMEGSKDKNAEVDENENKNNDNKQDENNQGIGHSNQRDQENKEKGAFGLGKNKQNSELINFRDVYKRYLKGNDHPAGFEAEIGVEPDRQPSDYDDEILEKIDSILEKNEEEKEIIKQRFSSNNPKRFKFVPPKITQSQNNEKKKRNLNQMFDSQSEFDDEMERQEHEYETEYETRIRCKKVRSIYPNIVRKMKVIRRRGKKILLSSSDSAVEEIHNFSGERSISTAPIEISSG